MRTHSLWAQVRSSARPAASCRGWWSQQRWRGGINILNTEANAPLLAGNLISVGLSAVLTVAISLMFPEPRVQLGAAEGETSPPAEDNGVPFASASIQLRQGEGLRVSCYMLAAEAALSQAPNKTQVKKPGGPWTLRLWESAAEAEEVARIRKPIFITAAGNLDRLTGRLAPCSPCRRAPPGGACPFSGQADA